MRICLLSARFPPQRCGVGDYTYFLAGALARIGHSVDVVTSVGELNELLYPLPAGVRVHRKVSDWGVMGLPSLSGRIHDLDPQVLLIQYTPHSFDRRGISLAVNMLPVLLRRASHVRVVTNFHELYISFNSSLRRNAGALWQRLAGVLLASGSHGISVTTSEWEHRLQKIGIGKRVTVIPVGSNIPQVIVTDEERVRLRKEILRGSDGVLIVGFGARHDRDMSAVLGALTRLRRYVKAKLVWIGGANPDGGHGSKVEQATQLHSHEDDLQWTGMLPPPQVSRLLGASDVMILPFIDGVSSRRTSAVTALEHGLPLLTTRGACLEPWFVHGENVYLSPVGDVGALGEALVELARKPEIRARLGKGARELYETHFAWDVIARQVAALAENSLQP